MAVGKKMGLEMRAAAQTMRADAEAMVGATADTAPLLGNWVNARRSTDDIAKVLVTERDGTLLVRLQVISDDGLVDWGEAEAVPYMSVGTTQAEGFHARYELVSTLIDIAANVSQGILVIQTYSSFHDGSSRLSRFSREFFYRSVTEPVLGDVRSDRSFLAGDWVNTRANTKWVKGFTLTDKGNGYSLRVTGINEPIDWGETAVATFMASNGMPTFHAHYDLGSVEVLLAGNVVKDVIIIGAFHRFNHDESANAFWREFFVKPH